MPAGGRMMLCIGAASALGVECRHFSRSAADRSIQQAGRFCNFKAGNNEGLATQATLAGLLLPLPVQNPSVCWAHEKGQNRMQLLCPEMFARLQGMFMKEATQE